VSALTAALRRLVRERAAARCEYCLLAKDDAYLPHEPDHVIAVKHGGVTDASNLALTPLFNRSENSLSRSYPPSTIGLGGPARPRRKDPMREPCVFERPSSGAGRATFNDRPRLRENLAHASTIPQHCSAGQPPLCKQWTSVAPKTLTFRSRKLWGALPSEQTNAFGRSAASVASR
jgi:hypothetical protein